MRPATFLQCFALDSRCSKAKHCRNFLGRVLGQKNFFYNCISEKKVKITKFCPYGLPPCSPHLVCIWLLSKLSLLIGIWAIKKPCDISNRRRSTFFLNCNFASHIRDRFKHSVASVCTYCGIWDSTGCHFS